MLILVSTFTCFTVVGVAIAISDKRRYEREAAERNRLREERRCVPERLASVLPTQTAFSDSKAALVSFGGDAATAKLLPSLRQMTAKTVEYRLTLATAGLAAPQATRPPTQYRGEAVCGEGERGEQRP